MSGRSTILLNPLLPVTLTFVTGFLVWYFFMPATSLVIGIAPRHESADGYFRFFILFSGFLAGMYAAEKSDGGKTAAASLSDASWLRIGWLLTVTVLVADYLYIRSGLGQLGGETSYVDTIHEFANTVRENSSFGITSLNNLFALPLVIGTSLLMTPRKVSLIERIQGAIMFALMISMTLAHGAVGFGRIWFLFSIMTTFAIWVIERRPKLTTQFLVLFSGALFATIFIVVMEALRNIGLTAQATGLNLNDPRIIRLIFLTLSQAYVASDINNAMIVFDCHPANSMISTVDVIAKLVQSATGADFPSYADCVGWTSIFGTINFLALMWWDWGYMALPVVFAIAYGMQRSYRAAVAPANGLSFAVLLFPNVLFGAMHLTRSMFIGSTEFLLPAAALLLLYMLHRLGVGKTAAAPGHLGGATATSAIDG